jgi:hypothetical protein
MFSQLKLVYAEDQTARVAARSSNHLQRIRSILVFVSGPERGVDRLDKRMRIYRRSCPAGTGLLLPVGALRALLARAKVIATKSAAARRKSSRPRVAVDRTGAALAAARHVRGCPG